MRRALPASYDDGEDDDGFGKEMCEFFSDLYVSTATPEAIEAAMGGFLHKLGGARKMLAAAKRGDAKTVRRLAARGYSVHTALHFQIGHGGALYAAAHRGDVETFSTLLELGADIDEADEVDLTSLQLAVDGEERAVALLVAEAADVNRRTASHEGLAQRLHSVTVWEIVPDDRVTIRAALQSAGADPYA